MLLNSRLGEESKEEVSALAFSSVGGGNLLTFSLSESQRASCLWSLRKLHKNAHACSKRDSAVWECIELIHTYGVLKARFHFYNRKRVWRKSTEMPTPCTVGILMFHWRAACRLFSTFFFPSPFPSVFSNLRLFFNFSLFLRSLAEEKEKRIPHELLNCEA